MNIPRDIINWTGAAVAVGLVAILGFLTWALVFRTVPTENNDALLLLIGNLTGLVGIVVAFYFGSSSTQRKQQDTIDTLAKTVSPPVGSATVIPPGESATVTAPASGGATVRRDQ